MIQNIKNNIKKNKNFFWVVIPAFNESKTIGKVLEKTMLFSDNIIVVNDGSADTTSEIAKEKNVIVLDHAVNLGKGAALKTGCDYAIKLGAEIIVAMDADGQHLPEDIPLIVKRLQETNSDIVFSYRKLNKTMPFILQVGNIIISGITNFLYNINIKDSQCGFRCFTAEAYKKIRWQANDYSMESEMIAHTGKNKLKYAELHIQTIYLDKYKGTTVLDGVKVVLYMLWWRLLR